MNSQLKVKLLLNLPRTDQEEPPISNEEQIRSFGSYGVWLRVLTAYRLIRDYRGGGATVSNVSTIVGLYEQLGMFFEDIVCTVAAWGASTLDTSVRIADVLERTAITSRQVASASAGYHQSVFQELATSTKRVQVNAAQLIQSLSALRSEALLRQLGVDWKRAPSVKYVSKDRKHQWSQLPMVAENLFNSFQDPKAHLVSISYNKLKHGPQFIIMAALDAARRRGLGASKREEEIMEHAFVRVLHQGARTQENETEVQAGKRVAPFLVGDQQALSGWLFETMAFTAINMFLIADWKYRRMSGEHLERPTDPLIKAMLDEKEARLRELGYSV